MRRAATACDTAAVITHRAETATVEMTTSRTTAIVPLNGGVFVTGHVLVVDGGHCVATPPLGMTFA